MMMAALYVLIVGVVATAALDLWQQVCRLVFGLPITDWGLIGRWVGHFRDGQFTQPDIGRAAPVPGERPLGWLVHYAVGIGYGVVYLALMWLLLGTPPSLLSALVFAALSVGVTWFFMEPVLGAGVMAAKVPNRPVALAHDLTSHLAMGLGLWAGDLIARPLIGG
jgi:hypothetical protein